MPARRRFFDADGSHVALETAARRLGADGWRIVDRDRSTVTLRHEVAPSRWWPVAEGVVNLVLTPLTILVGPLPLPVVTPPRELLLRLRFRGDGVVARRTTAPVRIWDGRLPEWEAPDGRGRPADEDVA